MIMIGWLFITCTGTYEYSVQHCCSAVAYVGLPYTGTDRSCNFVWNCQSRRKMRHCSLYVLLYFFRFQDDYSTSEFWSTSEKLWLAKTSEHLPNSQICIFPTRLTRTMIFHFPKHVSVTLFAIDWPSYVVRMRSKLKLKLKKCNWKHISRWYNQSVYQRYLLYWGLHWECHTLWFLSLLAKKWKSERAKWCSE
jgi:hypothetical protein